MEELLYYVIDDSGAIVYIGDYEECKIFVIESDYPLYTVSDLTYDK